MSSHPNTQHSGQMGQNNLFKTEKTIEIQLVRLTEVRGKVLSEKNGLKSVKTALLLSNILWVLNGVLAQFYE